MTAAVRLAILAGDAPAASTPYIAPAYTLDMMVLALASAFAGKNLSFISCCFAFFPPFIECAAAGRMSGGEVGTQVSEVGDNLYAAPDMLPGRIAQPLFRFGAACKFIALSGATFAPIIWRYSCVTLSAPANFVSIFIPVPIMRTSSASIKQLIPVNFLMMMIHGLMISATLVIEKGHP